VSGTGIRREALREIAREKAWLGGRIPRKPSPEEARKEKSIPAPEGKRRELPQEEGIAFQQASPEQLVVEDRGGDDSSSGWVQFRPWEKDGAEKKPRKINTATIWCAAKKMIAREWRRARGIEKRDPRVEHLEREASLWREKKEAERIRQQEARRRFEEQKRKLDEALAIIGQRILEHKDNLTSDGAAALVEDAMQEVGEVYDVQWKPDGCDIWIEPWEEMRSRRDGQLPTVYKIEINGELEMTSYELVDDEEIRRALKTEILGKRLARGLNDEPLGTDDGEITDAVEKKVDALGRLVDMKKWNGNGWLVVLEPWEEMRVRNIQRKGKGPVKTECILVKVVDGTIITAPVRETESSKRTEETERELTHTSKG